MNVEVNRRLDKHDFRVEEKEHLKDVVVTGSMTIKPPPGIQAESNKRWVVPFVLLFLAVITLAVYGQTLRYEFVDYDDSAYVYENPVVQKGLTWAGLHWALTYGEIGHWHPLTWLSHMLDCQIYGLNAGGHHLTNVLLHTASVLILFLVLRRMTGVVWRSAFVAAVFAVHPLRVESVAWVSERKDVLSGFFFMLTLWAYVHYVCQTQSARSMVRYGAVVIFFALGLLSKDMLVTLPFVLLLLDYWPFKRFSDFTPEILLRLVIEKIPLFMLAAASCVATALVPEKLGANLHLPFALRMENGVVCYVTYLWQMVYPSGLACLYPNPTGLLPLWRVFGALGLLLAISGVALIARKSSPWLIVGWLWYLGMMVPVIGIVQISFYAHADRYTYLPQIGIYIAITWAAGEFAEKWQVSRAVLGSLMAGVITVLMVCAWNQTAYWKNGVTLWSHALACTPDNAYARYGLGDALAREGQLGAAIVEYQKALAINPNYADPYNNLGDALAQKGQVDAAIVEYQKALAINPNYAQACNNLGNALVQKGQLNEAIIEYQKALAIDPNFADPYCDLGNALAQKGQLDEAIIEYQKALAINPNNAQACNDFGIALAQKGQVDEAIAEYQKALAINPNNADLYDNLGIAEFQKGEMDVAIIQFQKALVVQPDYVTAQNNLARIAWVLATSSNPSLRNGTKAVELAQQIDQLTGGSNPMMAATVAAAYAETGKFTEAISNAQRALQLASSQNNAALMAALQAQLKCYQTGSPFRDSGTTP
jgi:protein O-mannosyl-transferase